MLKNLLDLSNLGGDFENLRAAVRGGTPSAAFGVSFSEKCHLAGGLKSPVLYIVKDPVYAMEVCRELRDITGGEPVFLPAKDDVLLYKKAVSKDSLFSRLNALYRMTEGVNAVVTTFEALLQLFPSKMEIIRLKKSTEYEQSEFIRRLIALGYERTDTSDSKGLFSVRGDIVDVFPVNHENPYRISFFGDEIDDIRRFDADTRDNLGYLSELDIAMATDVIIEDAEIPSLIGSLVEARGEHKGKAGERADELISELIGALKDGRRDYSLSFILPLLKNTTADIWNYLPSDATVVFDECKPLYESMQNSLKEFSDRLVCLKEGGEAFGFSKFQAADENELISVLTSRRCLALQLLTTQINFFRPEAVFSFNCTPVSKYYLRADALAADIKSWRITGYRVAVCAGSKEKAESLQDSLNEQKAYAGRVRFLEAEFEDVKITEERLYSGFIYHDIKLAVIGTGDLYAKKDEPAKRLKRRRNDLFSAPEIGDFAVHETHGIGLVKQTKQITTAEGTKDYIMLEYSGGDLLYVPVEQMDILSRYMGEGNPPLSKLGGKDFSKVKERVRTSIRKMAFDLKELYRERNSSRGFAFSPDNELTKQFSEAFPFEETEDQLKCIAEIKEDMESSRVMDRLLCGDVGYGKTEVAFRGVFKAVLDGKQAALLAPTTILTQQHYNTAVERFKDFGIRIEVLNRFKSDENQRRIIADTMEGKVDLLIGTHRLLGKDVIFKDLGLLILDEEQRFGVEHKERLKLMKKNVDTLTMTATPIPRTLHMSLSGIRDISTIETPIKERLPVQTYVVEETDTLIRDAVIRELSREGQAFILFNRVAGIHSFAHRIAGIVPEAKITVAHGQMDEKSLENAVLKFFKNESNILITTTIIENGIDLPNANTIIVIDSDRLGLSQLYQLKGRVGRSSRLAHAYFTFKRDKVLSETAYKRLSAIMEFTRLGSGFKIAMRDLEIRGAGNVLGKEQHGHMDRIGYELYSKLIREEMTGEQMTGGNISLDLRLSAFIPEAYIESGSARMDAYKQIAEIVSKEDIKRVTESLEDLYGTMPFEVENLIKIACLKALAKKYRVSEIVLRKDNRSLVLENLDALNNENLHNSVKKFGERVKITFDKTPVINFFGPVKDMQNGLDEMTAFLTA